MRVSLVPAATEISRFLGVELVGSSHCCDYPGKPVLTKSILPGGLSQSEIDQRVSEACVNGQSLYRVNEALLEALHPDLILTPGVCKVCAMAPEEVGRAVGCLSYGVPSITWQGARLEGLFDDLRRVGETPGLEVEEPIRTWRERLDAVRQAVKGLPPGDPSPRVTWERIRGLQPEVLLYDFCRFTLPQTLEELHRLGSPLHTGQMWVLDSQHFVALTPKVVRGVEILANLLHSELTGHAEGKSSRNWTGPHPLEAQWVGGGHEG